VDRKRDGKNMSITQRLDALRALMRENGIDAYMIPSDDFHGSEYVGDYFKCREFVTGFTGSAGTALILSDEAYLWTDGRYFLQAEDQLQGTGITLMKIGQEGVPTVEEFLEKKLDAGQTLGFDGRCVTYAAAEPILKRLGKNDISCVVSGDEGPLDLVGDVWKDRPAMSCESVWELDISYTGLSRAEKLAKVREEMKKKNCGYHIVSSLDDIAWLLNLRGRDIIYNPVFMSYFMILPDRAVLFAQKRAFGRDIEESLLDDGVELHEYDEVISFASQVPEKARVMLDPASVNVTLWRALGHTEIISGHNPAILMKAVKNRTEMEHMRQAHIQDGVAVCRFIYWLKKELADDNPDNPVTELSAVQKLLEFRQEREHFLEASFETIAGYGSHGAIVHYEPTPESDIPLKPEGFLLLDSGGQYMEGTTDITRTIACGRLTDEEKEYYTRVLRGNLNLGAARFLYGCTGMSLDYLARQPLWEIGADYNHGTGHGVGFLLNVHEGPNSINYKNSPNRPLPCVMEEGMITSNEPGFYLEGKFGVRCENLMLCVKDEKNEYGQFMHFETLTMVPWEIDAIVPELLSGREKSILNEYHAKVYETISPYLGDEEKAWLREATRAV